MCGNIDIPDDPNLVNFYTGSIDPAYLATFEPVVYNIYFWSIQKDDGTGKTIANENIALEAVANLNIAYNDFNVFFKYRGFDNTSFNATTYRDGASLSEIKSYAEDYGFIYPNSFNVYVPRTLNRGGGQAQYRSTFSAVIQGRLLSYTNLAHEIGHNFFLHHTFRFYDDPILCEYVNRDPNILPFNALDNGDKVLDTAAAPLFMNDDPNDVNLQTCEYVGQGSDCQDPPRPYEIFEEDIRNMMNGAANPDFWSTGCQNIFSVGQKIRVRETIAFFAGPLIPTAQTTIASLYEPYKGEYYVSGPIDNGPSSSFYKPLFQPGFDYRFVECECNQEADCSEPTPWENGTADFSYTNNALLSIDKDIQSSAFNTITHPNHTAIKILNGNSYLSTIPTEPRRCYDNWNRAPIGGNITRFNDGVFNANVTITPQDSTGINNPNLINNLQPGLYNLQKIYEDGAQQEQVIVKENE